MLKDKCEVWVKPTQICPIREDARKGDDEIGTIYLELCGWYVFIVGGISSFILGKIYTSLWAPPIGREDFAVEAFAVFSGC